MRRYLGVILVVVVVFGLLIALSTAGMVEFDRPPENELQPQRSSYNPGPTGTRAFYQLLEESGYDVARWREPYKGLNRKTSEVKDAVLIVIGPFIGPKQYEAGEQWVLPEEQKELRNWVNEGGRLLIVSRNPQAQFNDTIGVVTKSIDNLDKAQTEDLIADHSDVLIAQPTELTQGLKGLAVSKLASRLKFHSSAEKAVLKIPEKVADSETESPTPAPVASPTPNVVIEKQEDGSIATTVLPELETPVVHLGDGEGAVLADFEYGKGRVIFLSDPFPIANNGIAQGSNLTLALNLINALSKTSDGKSKPIFFDEYHHGYESQGNSVIAYFRGTPMFWLTGQLLLVAALVVYTSGRRFARALPLPQTDRHSPLEFVGSMANLQQVAQARDLALENIYPRFKTKVCRSLGLSVSASPREIAARLKLRMKVDFSEAELYRIFTESERVLGGAAIDDQKLIDLVASMRRISSRIAK